MDEPQTSSKKARKKETMFRLVSSYAHISGLTSLQKSHIVFTVCSGQFLVRVYRAHFFPLVAHIRSTLQPSARSNTGNRRMPSHDTMLLLLLVVDLRTRPVRRHNGAGSVFRIERCAMRNHLSRLNAYDRRHAHRLRCT